MRLDEMEIPLERDVFLRSLIRELSGVLEDVVGIKEASGFVSVVGRSIGEWMNGEYRKALRVSPEKVLPSLACGRVVVSSCLHRCK